jgi:hypothetical protein
MRTLIAIGILALLFTGCKSSEGSVTTEEAQQTRALIENGNFEINMTWANPMVTNELSMLSNNNLLPVDSRTGQINLVGTNNFIKKHGDSLEVYLPYFGTRQLGASMTAANGAIEFEGIPEDYEYSYNEAKAQSNVQFEIDEGNERYTMYLTISANKRVSVRVNSSQRTSISYKGQVGVLADKN